MLLRRTVLALSVVCALLVASASTACSSDAVDCTVSATSKSCEWDTARVRACAAVTTGIYGTVSYGCSDHCPTYNYPSWCPGTTLTVTDATGHATTIPVSNGFYALPLAPGAYEVCSQFTYGRCARITLVDQRAIEIAVGGSASPGGIYESLFIDGARVQ